MHDLPENHKISPDRMQELADCYKDKAAAKSPYSPASTTIMGFCRTCATKRLQIRRRRKTSSGQAVNTQKKRTVVPCGKRGEPPVSHWSFFESSDGAGFSNTFFMRARRCASAR